MEEQNVADWRSLTGSGKWTIKYCHFQLQYLEYVSRLFHPQQANLFKCNLYNMAACDPATVEQSVCNS